MLLGYYNITSVKSEVKHADVLTKPLVVRRIVSTWIFQQIFGAHFFQMRAGLFKFQVIRGVV